MCGSVQIEVSKERILAHRDIAELRIPFPQLILERKCHMSLGTILLIIVVLLLIGAFPAWPYSSGWGYGPSGALGLILLILIILLVTGRL